MRTTKFWVGLIALVLGLSLTAVLWLNQRGQAGTQANIYVDGVCIYSIDLQQVTERKYLTVEGAIGVNVLEMEQGRIRVVEADCPDQICVRQGWAEDGLLPVVCLPNRVVIELGPAGQAQAPKLDGVTR